MSFICPVCAKGLKKEGKSLVCENNHLFDIAKKGYVNLLLGHSGGLHGDSKEMVNARSEFLETGVYDKLKAEIIKAVGANVIPKNIEDCGCGEGYYTSAVQLAYPESHIVATDISKFALNSACKRNSDIEYAVASTFSLPIPSNSQDVALNIFSPFVREEYYRTLKSDGILVMAIPLENHLYELKSVVYDNPYKNEPHSTFIDGFSLIDEKILNYSAVLDNSQIKSLFKMTPYYIKTSESDMEKLNAVSSLEISFSFGILTYKKQ